MQLTQTGLEAIEQTFARARAENRATFMPYFTIGYPDLPTSVDIIEMLVEAGADAIEIGVPFSDPLADGPTVQHAGQIALANGIRTTDCLEAVRTLRKRGVRVPMVLMGYMNPIVSYGLERYARDVADAGASGLIVPDLPPEEAGELGGFCAANGLALIPMLAPTSTPDRIRQVLAGAHGYVYLVSVTGITGVRSELPPELASYVQRVRSLTSLPLAIGFGIATPDQAHTVASIADGVVVGSAMIKAGGISAEAARSLAASLRAACVR